MPCIPLVAYAVPSSTSDCQTLLKEANKKSLTRDLMCQTRALLICLTVVCSIAVWSILDPILEPFLRKLPPEMIGVIFLVMATTYAASSPLWGWLSDKVVSNKDKTYTVCVNYCTQLTTKHSTLLQGR
ncbi:MFS-type transporter SLC18B1-like [Dreissena polymorpha]|uniref:MFS-type transporter SLC18B1-like n=1 Tax=Dreissena polymorpha TaxID=45954 RepID=UPI0022642676|nr:MFS-type transporter SLC18B1-like [Dreissena polymorpha]